MDKRMARVDTNLSTCSQNISEPRTPPSRGSKPPNLLRTSPIKRRWKTPVLHVGEKNNPIQNHSESTTSGCPVDGLFNRWLNYLIYLFWSYAIWVYNILVSDSVLRKCTHSLKEISSWHAIHSQRVWWTWHCSGWGFQVGSVGQGGAFEWDKPLQQGHHLAILLEQKSTWDCTTSGWCWYQIDGIFV